MDGTVGYGTSASFPHVTPVPLSPPPLTAVRRLRCMTGAPGGTGAENRLPYSRGASAVRGWMNVIRTDVPEGPGVDCDSPRAGSRPLERLSLAPFLLHKQTRRTAIACAAHGCTSHPVPRWKPGTERTACGWKAVTLPVVLRLAALAANRHRAFCCGSGTQRSASDQAVAAPRSTVKTDPGNPCAPGWLRHQHRIRSTALRHRTQTPFGTPHTGVETCCGGRPESLG